MSHEDPPGGYPYQPYGAPYGDQPPPHYGQGQGHGQGYGPPPRPSGQGPQASAIIALVLNLLAVVSCCNLLAIPGSILAGLAMGRSGTEPDKARGLLVWSWVLFGAGFVLTIGLFVFLGLIGAFDD
jgi:cytochrome c biogenesis protein CcdA